MAEGTGDDALQRSDIERLARRLQAIARRRSLDYVELTSALLTYRTVSGATEAEEAEVFEREMDACLEFVGERLERLGFGYLRYDNLVAVGELEGADGDETIGVATHLDVVPPGADWTVPPFGGAVRDGSIWGRGAQDDKGPVAAIIAAFDALRCLDEELDGSLELRRNVKLLFGTREETERWPDMDLLAREEDDPEFVVVPDGAYPVINAEKGIVTVAAHLGWSGGHESHPDLTQVEIHSGLRANAVPDRAVVDVRAPSREQLDRSLDAVREGMARRAPDADYQVGSAMPLKASDRWGCRIELWGEAAHAAYPEKGHNAALDALACVGLLPTAHPAVLRFAEAVRSCCKPLDGSALGLRQDDPYFGRTTVSLGTLHMAPGSAEASVNVRFPLGIKPEEIERGFAERLAAVAPSTLGADLSVGFRGRVQPPIYVDAHDHRDLLGPLNAAYEAVTGRSGGYASLAGTTYAKAFPLAVAFGPIDFSAGDEEMAHEPDERVSVERHLENIAVYATALFLLAYDWSALERL